LKQQQLVSQLVQQLFMTMKLSMKQMTQTQFQEEIESLKQTPQHTFDFEIPKRQVEQSQSAPRAGN